jgi:hypothetical protein
MKNLLSLRLLSLLAGVALMTPATGLAKDKDRGRDHGSRGSWSHRGHDHDRHSDHHWGGNRSYRGSSYRGYYPYSYGYRPFGYGYGYGYNYGPSVSIYSSYSRPSYAYDSYADDLAVDVQRALKRRGYYRGGVDGDIGPGSRAAIRQYQANHRLPVTGRIDRDLLRSLGIG